MLGLYLILSMYLVFHYHSLPSLQSVALHLASIFYWCNRYRMSHLYILYFDRYIVFYLWCFTCGSWSVVLDLWRYTSDLHRLDIDLLLTLYFYFLFYLFYFIPFQQLWSVAWIVKPIIYLWLCGDVLNWKFSNLIIKSIVLL